jgi:hypothetical protein
MSTAPPLNEPICPLCGGANQCAVVRSGSFDVPCWCEGVAFDRGSLDAVAPRQRARACLCPACAAGVPAPALAASTPVRAELNPPTKVDAPNRPDRDCPAEP